MLKKISLLMCLGLFLNTFSQINSGSPSIPFGSNTSYDYGMMPSNLPTNGTYGQAQDAADAYNSFKTNFIVDCGSNAARVKFDDESFTVSEGIGYSMLLAAYAADQTTFNKLWQYYKNHMNNNGVMNWKIQGCNTTNGFNGATDAELDAATALIVANKQWGSTNQTHDYKNDAITLIENIRDHEVGSSDLTFNNGDGWGDADGCRNPSYQAPAYARLYNEFLEDNNENVENWSSIAAATATMLVNNSDVQSSGLPSNWSLKTGQPSGGCSGSGTDPFSFGFDACRAPWREGTDYLWYGTSSMQTITNTQIDFWISKGGADQVQGGNSFKQDGTGSGYTNNNSFVSMIGAQALAATSTTTHQNFVDAMYTKSSNTNTTGYFAQVLRCLGLFSQTGNFWNPYSSEFTSGNSKPTTSITSPSDGFTTCVGVDYTISASASDSDGSISKVEFYENGILIGTDLTSPYSFEVVDNTSGIKTYQVKAYDDENSVKSSSSIEVTVSSIQSPDGVTCEGLGSEDYNAAIDEFDSEDPVSIGSTGDYGIYWWADDSDVYTITRNSNNMTVDLDNASPGYNVFGVSFGEDKYINLEDFSNADIKLNVTNNSNTDIRLTVQIKDINGNTAEIEIADEDDITWSNPWVKMGIDIDQGETVEKTLNLSTPNLLGGYSALSWGCAEAVECPVISYDLDPSKISEVVFIVNGGAETTDNPDLPIATGSLVFNYFSIGEIDSENSKIIKYIEIVDTDADGIADDEDLCPATPLTETANTEGCSDSQLDTDNDGISDADDLCAATPSNETANSQGCSDSQVDTDNDGVSDADDLCAATPSSETANNQGCSDSQVDTDNDGISDADDLCAATPSNETANSQGCSDSQIDTDNDGVPDVTDLCPSTTSGSNVDADGCEIITGTDTDNDGIDDGQDICPATPSNETANSQGCSDSQLDSDNDGVSDADDTCPSTTDGVTVDADGCEIIIDTDNDGISDGLDICPATPSNETANNQGCSNSQLDSDNDGVSDADDLCESTTDGVTVDTDGCEIVVVVDSDNDGISDGMDICPATPSNETANNEGCSNSQLDSDNDGVTDDIDLCPNTITGVTVDNDGCIINSSSLYTPITTTLTDDSDFDFGGIDYAYDNFSSINEKFDNATGSGVFWWDGEKEENGEVFYSSTKEREACDEDTPGSVTYTVTQNATKYEPFGVAFGTASDNTPFTIDLTNNSELELEMTNESSRSLTIRAALQDYAGNILDYDANKSQIQFTLAAGATKSLSTSFENGYWYDFNTAGCNPCINEAADFFDFAHIKGLNITVISGGDHWKDIDANNIVDADISITTFKLGNTDGVLSTACGSELLDTDDDGISDAEDICPNTIIGAEVDVTGCEVNGLEDNNSFGIELFPIPAKETLNIVQTRTNMTKATLFSVSGRMVLQTELNSNSESISIDGIASGMYILQLEGEEGSTQKQLIIE